MQPEDCEMTASDMSAPAPQGSMVLVDLRIPFLRLVFFFVKAALAVIPAAIIVSFLAMMVAMIMAAIFGEAHFMMRRWI
jgi:hypothetical protein